MKRTTIGMVFVAALFAAPASAQSFAPTLALLTGSGLDLATTLIDLRAAPGQLKEGNPLLSHGGEMGLKSVKIASTVAIVVAMHLLETRGHSRVAKVIGYSGGIVLTGLAMRNASLLKR